MPKSQKAFCASFCANMYQSHKVWTPSDHNLWEYYNFQFDCYGLIHCNFQIWSRSSELVCMGQLYSCKVWKMLLFHSGWDNCKYIKVFAVDRHPQKHWSWHRLTGFVMQVSESTSYTKTLTSLIWYQPETSHHHYHIVSGYQRKTLWNHGCWSKNQSWAAEEKQSY